jgi:hypothetical protein
MSMRFPAVIVDVWGVLADQFPPGATPWDGISYVRLGCA